MDYGKMMNDMDGLLLDELEGLNEFGGEQFPFIQLINDGYGQLDPSSKEGGGFFMTMDNVDLAGDVPKGAQEASLVTKQKEEKPGVFVRHLELVPLGFRKCWRYEKERLPQNYDYKRVVAAHGGKTPKSNINIYALVKGNDGLFVAKLTFYGMNNKDLEGALQEQKRNVAIVLRKSGVSRQSRAGKAAIRFGWRWHWMTLVAGKHTTEKRGENEWTSTPINLALGIEPEYMGNELRDKYFVAELDEIKRWEQAWDTAYVPEEQDTTPAYDGLSDGPPPPADIPSEVYDDNGVAF